LTSTHYINLAVVVGYLLMIVGVGAYFAIKRKSASQFMLADRTMPGWAVGLSMFGSYISSISFLGNPATSFSGNWMWAGFTLATPIGLLVGTTVFMRFYRRSGAVSAYTHLESRFGPWARTYAVFTFLVLQMARMGTVLYLLSQAVVPLLGTETNSAWTARMIIIVVGVLIMLYTLFGGIEAVVWTGVLQSVVLLLGPLIVIATLLLKMPGGAGEIVSAGAANGKFEFGPYAWNLAAPMFWLVILNAILEHLRNWGIDQSYIQRYLAARSERDAARSIWIAGLLYMPVALFFFFIGTALWAFYRALPDRLPSGTMPDSVFPYFISHELAPGLSGLVIAAIFAASMDSNLNSMATLTLVDGYKRYVKPNAGDRESLRVLWASTIFWGVASIGYGLFMTLKGSTTTLQFTANLSGLLAGGILGLFLLALMSKRRVTSGMAATAVTIGVFVITWMTLSRIKIGPRAVWPEAWAAWRSPWHEMTAGIVGTAVILAVGFGLAMLRPRRRATNQATTDPLVEAAARSVRS
jgi:SSS family solute:Na+ symporter